MKKILALLVFASIVAYLLFWPVPIEPVAWDAPEAPALEGDYAVNDKLASVSRIGEGEGIGPEDVAVDGQGKLYVGYEDGRIVRFDANGKNPDLIANTGGRPLGLDFDPLGNLIVADGYKGLLSIAESGAVTTLSLEAEGIPFAFTDDVDVDSKGIAYFTDASSKFGPAMKARDDVLEHGGHGRFLKYDPATGSTEVLLDGLQFANGVALSENEDFVLVTETGNYSIVRYWLKGDKAGTHDIFFENLPGIPDGISANGDGTFWVALFSPRNAMLDNMSDKPLLRKVAFRLPQFLQPQPAHHGFVLGLNEQGEVTHNLQDAGKGAFAPITSIEQFGNTLYLGSLTAPTFAAFTLPENDQGKPQ
ncbi:SMP-30/gluconolactonase/LRE family protein [Alcanivorax sp. DP30]|uniref:SMP-30/gluconolactonase/LRE family protein n=1 Tax=Alcanivorax sp. DP30 TaxID=2606217 RepID=UPI00136F5EFE|nr:SMP-30/gluconolactonase/LRE family protein [Alcanivorax sp. DP30]MZR61573.1 SMP-30/gluconolactonase/LRE family protein [Alcanivorax sp. DP30]